MADIQIRKWVRDYLAEVLTIPEAEVELDRTLESYGLDSIEAVLMAGGLEEELGFEIDPAAFLQYPTIEAMVVALEQGEGLEPLADLPLKVAP
ncbi:MAG: acyl carrier protein [Caulobacteraceae bacterium]